MKNKYMMMLMIACLMGSTLAFAEDDKVEAVMDAGKDMMKKMIAEEIPAAQAPVAAAPVAEQPAMDPAQMEKMKALMAPTAAHKTLEAMVGKWNYTSKFWMAADGKAEETGGVSENVLIYGGRFLKQEVKGTWMGQPFEGTGIVGYDNVRGQYQSIWFDSMMTGIMSMSGQFDAASNTLKESGKNSCPMTGDKERECRAEWKIVDANQNVYSSYTTGPDGKEFKAMEIVYTRAV